MRYRPTLNSILMLSFLLLTLATLASANAAPQDVLEPLGRFEALEKLLGKDIPRGAFRKSGAVDMYGEIVDKSVDRILSEIDNILAGEIPIGNFEYEGIQLRDCYIFGLNNGIERLGDADLTFKEQILRFVMGAKTGKLGVDCKFDSGQSKGEGSIATTEIDVAFDFQIKLAHGESPKVNSFQIIRLGDFEVKVTMNGKESEMIEGLIQDQLQKNEGYILSEGSAFITAQIQGFFDLFVLP